ncbi:DUF3095 domain-containing protein [Ascidiaceihabitans sp.]|uniref:DUF3095 domain-containing protein n=1 Tax=Ascidiaceihabitans sp. TaxID=1872644 RepID=UPI003298A35E
MGKDFEFYSLLPTRDTFVEFASAEVYTSLPDDWMVGTSDIVGSTGEIAKGRYKTVNMVGAAVISAQVNAAKGRALPYVFGGDGAAFACPVSHAQTAAMALAAVQVWAQEMFGIELRVAMVSVGDIRRAGHDVAVARYQASEGVDYAMFSGGGISWAEAQMKAGAHNIPAAPSGTLPDLEGLSCRWSHMKARSGTILSIVIQPAAGIDPKAFSDVCTTVLTRAGQLDRGGHPSPEIGPGTKWPPQNYELDAKVSQKDMPLGKRKRQVLFETAIAWLLLNLGVTIGGFDPKKYRREVAGNADYRKFDDGLKMTIDCDAATQADLQAILDSARADGILNYGLHTQDEAMMTCIVPSPMVNTHVHFIDGASGGYTQAAAQIKSG